jgi:hypothetical protein
MFLWIDSAKAQLEQVVEKRMRDEEVVVASIIVGPLYL